MWLGKNCSCYRVHKVLYTECQSWPWPLTPGPKINRVPPLIIHNWHVKFESDWTEYVVVMVPTRSYSQSAKFDLDLWLCDPKSIGSSSHHPQRICYVWKWSGGNCSLYRVHKVKRDGHTYASTHTRTHAPTHSPNHPRTAALLYPLQHCCEGITNLANSGTRTHYLSLTRLAF